MTKKCSNLFLFFRHQYWAENGWWVTPCLYSPPLFDSISTTTARASIGLNLASKEFNTYVEGLFHSCHTHEKHIYSVVVTTKEETKSGYTIKPWINLIMQKENVKKHNFIFQNLNFLPSVTPILSSGNGLSVTARLAALMRKAFWVVWLEHHHSNSEVLSKPPREVLAANHNFKTLLIQSQPSYIQESMEERKYWTGPKTDKSAEGAFGSCDISLSSRRSTPTRPSGIPTTWTGSASSPLSC